MQFNVRKGIRGSMQTLQGLMHGRYTLTKTDMATHCLCHARLLYKHRVLTVRMFCGYKRPPKFLPYKKFPWQTGLLACRCLMPNSTGLAA